MAGPEDQWEGMQDAVDFEIGRIMAENEALNVQNISLQNDNERLRQLNAEIVEVNKLLREACDVLISGMGGHNHWDWTQKHGAGCETCIQQREAKKKARELIAEAEKQNEKKTP